MFNVSLSRCIECESKCCSLSQPPWLSSRDVQTISDGLRIGIDSFAFPYEDFWLLRQHPTTKRCVFLTASGSCSIYTYRPFDCKLFPFDLMWDKDPNQDNHNRLRFILHQFCPQSQSIIIQLIMRPELVNIETEMKTSGFLDIVDRYASVDFIEMKESWFRRFRFCNL